MQRSGMCSKSPNVSQACETRVTERWKVIAATQRDEPAFSSRIKSGNEILRVSRPEYGHTADLYNFAGMIIYDAAKVFVKFRFPIADHRQTIFRCENNVREEMCMGHAWVTRVSHAWIFGHVTTRYASLHV